ncbi:MAG: sensor histidine kinase [Lachnospiraceae bacterium]|nr:sensor histidine kinase [Lachnospiraceae bacterium]
MERNKERTLALIKHCLKKNRLPLLMLVCVIAMNLMVFWLYGLNLEPFFYCAVLLLFLVGAAIVLDSMKERRRAEDRSRLLTSPVTGWSSMKEPENLEEQDYQEMVRQLGRFTEELHTAFDNEQQDTLDYYTAWVHQIKTPIAVMRLQLSGEDTDQSRALLAELFRIEQYVDMVLQYIRLGSRSNDLLVTEYQLDDLIRETIRKYASSFVQRRLALDFQPSGRTIVTDKKWFCLILEQFLSNAIKYTPSGGIRIHVDEEDRLCITDSGIGIAEEDLPRIFDKGFTGKNGRIGEKSSGLGLYLARRASELICRPVGARSKPGEGSHFYIDVSRRKEK